MARPIKSIQRNRRLTPEEAAKYRQVREQIAAELPEISQRIRTRVREMKQLAEVFSELKRTREAMGLSLSDVQEKTGIDRSALSKLENGVRENFTVDTVLRYAEAVGKQILFTLADRTTRTS